MAMIALPHWYGRREHEQYIRFGATQNSDHIEFPNIYDFEEGGGNPGENPFLVSCWLTLDAKTAPAGSSTIFSINDAGDTNGQLIYYRTTSNTLIHFRRNVQNCSYSGTGNADAYNSAADTWQHYLFGSWRSPADDITRFAAFKNGRPIASEGTNPTIADTGSYTGDGNWSIGNQKSTHTRSWLGCIYQLAVWRNIAPTFEGLQEMALALTMGAHPTEVEREHLIFAPEIKHGAIWDPISLMQPVDINNATMTFEYGFVNPFTGGDV